LLIHQKKKINKFFTMPGRGLKTIPGRAGNKKDEWRLSWVVRQKRLAHQEVGDGGVASCLCMSPDRPMAEGVGRKSTKYLGRGKGKVVVVNMGANQGLPI